MYAYKNNYTGEIYANRAAVPFPVLSQRLSGDLVGPDRGDSARPVCPHCHKSYRQGGLAGQFSVKCVCRACGKYYGD